MSIKRPPCTDATHRFFEQPTASPDDVNSIDANSYRRIFRDIPIGLIEIKPDTFIMTHANDRAAHLFGMSVSDLPGRSLLSLISENSAETLRKLDFDFKNGASRVHTFVIEGKRKDDAPVLLAVNAGVSYLSDSELRILLTVEDAAVRSLNDPAAGVKSFQDRLVRSERLAATGKLAASIAHEINSPLQGISSLLNVIRKSRPTDDELIDNLDLIKGAFASIRDTVNRLLDLNRPAHQIKQPVDINLIVTETLALVRGHLKKTKVTIQLDLSPDLPRVVASQQQLSQVFLNLINNAVEAMTGLSAVDTTMKQQTFFGGSIHIHSEWDRKNSMVNVTFSDNGPGIPEEELEHIFDPFFTRKKVMGMGVGLSICHGIIDDLKGVIAAENGKHGGAVFSIRLPVAP
ncbi:MAG: PAS domain-containing protein [Desulfobacteraceae bacterium]|nr:PAS domain-containing protein [Desulfobacteraceae bacterium]